MGRSAEVPRDLRVTALVSRENSSKTRNFIMRFHTVFYISGFWRYFVRLHYTKTNTSICYSMVKCLVYRTKKINWWTTHLSLYQLGKINFIINELSRFSCDQLDHFNEKLVQSSQHVKKISFSTQHRVPNSPGLCNYSGGVKSGTEVEYYELPKCLRQYLLVTRNITRPKAFWFHSLISCLLQ